MHYLGLDIGGTSIKYLIIDERNHKIFSNQIETTTESKELFLKTINDLVHQLMVEYNIMAVGIGFPGLVNTNSGEIYSAVNLGFDSLDLVNYIQKKFSIDCYILNDANAAAYAEYANNPNISDLLFVTLGTGCGGGIILNNKLHIGSNFVAGEIGHIPVEKSEGRVCGCGNIDCLETYVSKLGIIKSATKSKVIKKYLGDKEFDVVDVLNLHHDGVEEATLLLKDTFTLFAKTLAGIVNAIDVNHIVLGGGISNAGELLLDFIIDPLNRHLFPTLKNKVEVSLSKLKNEAGALGAASYAKDAYLNNN